MTFVWLGLVLGAAAALTYFLRRFYSPQRTRRKLLIPVALVHRACVDALDDLRGVDDPVFTDTFEPACLELTRISWADVAALGPRAASSHQTLVRMLDHWNAHAGSLRTTHDVAPLLSAGQRAAAWLLVGVKPEIDIEELTRGHGLLAGRMLRSVVALPPPPDRLVH